MIRPNYIATRTCSKCRAGKPLEDFYVRGGGRAGRQSQCIDCTKTAVADRKTRLGAVAVSAEFKACYNRRRAQRLEEMKAYRRKLRLDALSIYSKGQMRCACCSVSELAFLTVDHVNNDGAAHRRSIGSGKRGGQNIYLWLKKNGYPEGFGVLCWNCNCSKGHYGECPHETARREQVG